MVIEPEKKKPRYETLDDLPKGDYQVGKITIDADRLEDYSETILNVVLFEIESEIAMPLWALTFSCPVADVEGLKAWMKNEERGRDVKRKIEKELARRQDV